MSIMNPVANSDAPIAEGADYRNPVSPNRPHVTVCVCTFKRPHYLGRLLHELSRQETKQLFTYSIVIADNDFARSAENTISEFRDTDSVEVIYCVEPEQNIALARNRALENARGDYIAFIDDDEFPSADWLLKLFKACQAQGVAGVLGPVLPHFEEIPPRWVIKGRFYDRPTHPTGFRLDWTKCRTGNLIFRRQILIGTEEVFDPEYGSGGEDREFFRKMIQRGNVFIWCNEAAVQERVPSVRLKRGFMLRRALLRGEASLNHRSGPGDLAKSFVAVVGYALALPISLIVGHHFFMIYLIKACDHAGKLLAFFGLKPIREKYVIE